MIGQLKELVPRHNRRTITRIAIWGSLALCAGIWVNLLYRSCRVERADTVFREYFAIEDRLDSLKTAAADSAVRRSRQLAGSGVFDGWVHAATWLEAMQRFGTERGMVVRYSVDTLGTLAGGAPDICPVPIQFKINTANNFGGAVDFLQAVCGDSAVAVRLEKTEFFSGVGGLDNVVISITAWIRP